MQIPKWWSNDILHPIIPTFFPQLICESRLKDWRGAGLCTRENGGDEVPTEEWVREMTEDLALIPHVYPRLLLATQGRSL